jgi:hypothetical protein
MADPSVTSHLLHSALDETKVTQSADDEEITIKLCPQQKLLFLFSSLEFVHSSVLLSRDGQRAGSGKRDLVGSVEGCGGKNRSLRKAKKRRGSS